MSCNNYVPPYWLTIPPPNYKQFNTPNNTWNSTPVQLVKPYKPDNIQPQRTPQSYLPPNNYTPPSVSPISSTHLEPRRQNYFSPNQSPSVVLPTSATNLELRAQRTANYFSPNQLTLAVSTIASTTLEPRAQNYFSPNQPSGYSRRFVSTTSAPAEKYASQVLEVQRNREPPQDKGVNRYPSSGNVPKADPARPETFYNNPRSKTPQTAFSSYHNTPSGSYHNTSGASYHNTSSASYQNTPSNSYHNTPSTSYNKRRSESEPDCQRKPNKKRKKPLSQNVPQRKDWSVEDAKRAIDIEKNYNKRPNCHSLIIKFPDIDLNREIVSKFHPSIETVHFQQPSTPRFCFVSIHDSADPDVVISELNKTRFGNGFLSAEFKKEREEDLNIGPEDIDPLTLYVGNLAQEVTKEEMVKTYPKRKRIDIGYAKKMKYTRYAFVSFNCVDDSIEAFRKTHSTQMYSKSLIVRFRRLHGTVGMPGEPKPQRSQKDSESTTGPNESAENVILIDESEGETNSATWETIDITNWQSDSSEIKNLTVKQEPSEKTESGTDEEPCTSMSDPKTAKDLPSVEEAFAAHRPKLVVKKELSTLEEDTDKSPNVVTNSADPATSSPEEKPIDIKVEFESDAKKYGTTYDDLRRLFYICCRRNRRARRIKEEVIHVPEETTARVGWLDSIELGEDPLGPNRELQVAQHPINGGEAGTLTDETQTPVKERTIGTMTETLQHLEDPPQKVLEEARAGVGIQVEEEYLLRDREIGTMTEDIQRQPNLPVDLWEDLILSKNTRAVVERLIGTDNLMVTSKIKRETEGPLDENEQATMVKNEPEFDDPDEGDGFFMNLDQILEDLRKSK